MPLRLPFSKFNPSIASPTTFQPPLLHSISIQHHMNQQTIRIQFFLQR